MGVVWTGLVLHRTGKSAGPSAHANEPSGSIKFWDIL
jgi:hypothetical protein